MLHALEFQNGGRTFTCTVESMTPSRTDAWWWFRVSSDDRARYAPFRAERGDTAANVQERIVAYYEDLLLRRSQPAATHWARRRGTPPAPAKS